MQAIGITGISGQARNNSPPSAATTIKLTMPKIIIKKRITAPIMRESSLSMKSDICFWMLALSSEYAEIWRKGEKKVRKSKPNEKKSAKLRNLATKRRAKSIQPIEYHHCKKPTINITILYYITCQNTPLMLICN